MQPRRLQPSHGIISVRGRVTCACAGGIFSVRGRARGGPTGEAGVRKVALWALRFLWQISPPSCVEVS